MTPKFRKLYDVTQELMFKELHGVTQEFRELHDLTQKFRELHDVTQEFIFVQLYDMTQDLTYICRELHDVTQEFLTVVALWTSVELISNAG
jgi:hypothetical protein